MTVAFKRQPCSTPFDLMMPENRPRIYKLPIPHQHDCKPAKTSFYEKKLQKWNCLPGKFVPGNFNTYHLESMTCFGVADLVVKNPSNQTCWIRRSCENQGIKHPEPGPFFFLTESQLWMVHIPFPDGSLYPKFSVVEWELLLLQWYSLILSGKLFSHLLMIALKLT